MTINEIKHAVTNMLGSLWYQSESFKNNQNVALIHKLFFTSQITPKLIHDHSILSDETVSQSPNIKVLSETFSDAKQQLNDNQAE